MLATASCTAPPDVIATDSPASDAGDATADADPSDALEADAPDGGDADTDASSPPETLELSGDLVAHDSSVIEAEGHFYLFHTGPGIPYKRSDDLRVWEAVGDAFSMRPAWIDEVLTGVSDLWAPDVSWFNGSYHLYYAASTFGSGVSCIGHATKASLADASDWVDQGSIVCSNVGTTDDWDAIDPAVLTEVDGTRWMVFGSFGSGIKAIPLDDAGARLGDELYSLAERPVEVALQAPFALYRAPYYYLFVSFDRCCQGVSSTNSIRVGRSNALLGPYVDRSGIPMLEGGGTLLLEGNERWRGVGANTILSTSGRDYNVYHSYDANAAGQATLRISEVTWDDTDWPVSAGP